MPRVVLILSGGKKGVIKTERVIKSIMNFNHVVRFTFNYLKVHDNK